MAETPTRILLDWGTSSLRAMLMGDAGTVLDRRASAQGVATVKDGRFEPILREIVGVWLAEHGPLPIYGFGMIGSRNGWVETAYAPCPACAADIAARMERRELAYGLEVIFAPGLNFSRDGEAPDVMRGEEAHLFGLDPGGPSVAVLPGTHSKWARVADGTVEAFQTFVTGELFGLFATHSFVAGSKEASAPDPEAFADGLAAGFLEDSAAGGLLARLFTVRTKMLAGRLEPTQAGEFLSGLVIGSEFREAYAAGWFAPGEAVTLLGAGELISRYQRAAVTAGLRPVLAGTEVMIAGADRIARDYEARQNGT